MSTSQTLRDVCIQDPRRETAYFLTPSDLQEFEVGTATAASAENCVTFALAGESLLDALPTDGTTASTEPDILIRDPGRGTQFLVPYAELKRFEIDRPSDHPVAKTYTIPIPEALVEELPSAVRALLQTDFYSYGDNGPVLRDSK